MTVPLSRVLTLQEWTTVIAAVEDLAGNGIETVGSGGAGVDEPDRVDVAFLPCDTDQSGTIEPIDLLRFRQILEDTFHHAKGIDEDYVDMNRDGAIVPIDFLRFRQLLDGTGFATKAWDGESLLHSRP